MTVKHKSFSKLKKLKDKFLPKGSPVKKFYRKKTVQEAIVSPNKKKTHSQWSNAEMAHAA